MKKALGIMVAMFVITLWPFGGLWYALLKPLLGGGVDFSFLCPIYVGMILLAGIVVGCTVVICQKLDTLRAEIQNGNSSQND